jgi:hypothetical protein
MGGHSGVFGAKLEQVLAEGTLNASGNVFKDAEGHELDRDAVLNIIMKATNPAKGVRPPRPRVELEDDVEADQPEPKGKYDGGDAVLRARQRKTKQEAKARRLAAEA